MWKICFIFAVYKNNMKAKLIIAGVMIIVAIVGNARAQMRQSSSLGRNLAQVQVYNTRSGGYVGVSVSNKYGIIRHIFKIPMKVQDTTTVKNNIFYEGKHREYTNYNERTRIKGTK